MRCRVRARGLLLSSLPPPSPMLALFFSVSASLSGTLRGTLLSSRWTPSGGKSERTNKSARALRRDIVSCKVNHLRGSKTGLFTLPRPPLRLAKPRGDVCYLRSSFFARYFLPHSVSLSFCPASPLLLLSSSLRPPRPPFPRLQLAFLAVGSVSVNMRTHSLVISVIGSLMPAAALNAPA